MSSSTPIYRQTCVTCNRPALTLDQVGDPYCVDHADTFIAGADVSIALAEAEITVLLVHRTLVAAVG